MDEGKKTRPDHTGRQSVADVADTLSNMIPYVRHFLGRRTPLQVHEYRCDPGAGKAAQEVETRRLLERLLDPFGHLIKRVV